MKINDPNFCYHIRITQAMKGERTICLYSELIRKSKISCRFSIYMNISDVMHQMKR